MVNTANNAIYSYVANQFESKYSNIQYSERLEVFKCILRSKYIT